MQTLPLVPSQIQLLQQVINQIDQANTDMQFALGAGDQCYRLHCMLSDVEAELAQLIAAHSN
jgi:hypothetical protein